MKNVILIGPQGSGKGTQSDLLALKIRAPHIALGDILRDEVAKKSFLGNKVAELMNSGEIVPDEVVNRIIAERLAKPDCANGAILDGYPRTLSQADEIENILKSLNRPLTDVVYLNVSDEVAQERMSGRRICPNPACRASYHLQYHPPHKAGICDKCATEIKQRDDDNPEAIARRLAIYKADTVPLIELYRGQGLLREIPAEKAVGEVQAEILKILKV